MAAVDGCACAAAAQGAVRTAAGSSWQAAGLLGSWDAEADELEVETTGSAASGGRTRATGQMTECKYSCRRRQWSATTADEAESCGSSWNCSQDCFRQEMKSRTSERVKPTTVSEGETSGRGQEEVGEGEEAEGEAGVKKGEKT